MNAETRLASIDTIFVGMSVNQIYMTFDATDSFRRPDFTDSSQAYPRRSRNAVRDFEVLNFSNYPTRARSSLR